MDEQANTPRCEKPGGFCLNWRIRVSHPEFVPKAGSRRLPLVIGALLAAWVAMGILPAFADGPVRVGLYVQFEDGSTFTQCVTLDGPEATGLDVLRHSGLDLIFEAGGGMGTTICKIGETGCNYPGEDCFCQCLGTPCQYWTYWFEAEGQWKYSPLGASQRIVKDGDVESWVWGSGSESPPIEVLAEDICSPSATLTPPLLEGLSGEESAPPPARTSAVPTPAPTVSQPEPENSSASSQPGTPVPAITGLPTSLSPTPTETSPDGGISTFVWLVMGMSGMGIVLLGLAYFVMRGRL